MIESLIPTPLRSVFVPALYPLLGACLRTWERERDLYLDIRMGESIRYICTRGGLGTAWIRDLPPQWQQLLAEYGLRPE